MFTSILTIDPVATDFFLNVPAVDFLKLHGFLFRSEISRKIFPTCEIYTKLHILSSNSSNGPIACLLTFPFQFGIALYPPLTQIMGLHMADFSRRYIQFCYLLGRIAIGFPSWTVYILLHNSYFFKLEYCIK